MVKPESVEELHRLGAFVTEQHEGRKDQPVTGADFYNFAVQLDSNFASITSEFKSLRTDMNAEFKAVRAEMKEGFSELRNEMSRIPLKTTAWVAAAMTGLIATVCAVVAVVIAVV